MSDTGTVVVAGPRALPVRVIRRWVEAVLAGEGRVADVSVAFLSATAMRRLNAEYKGHDEVTDVISFPLPLPDGSLTGDIYLCRAYAAREAHARGIPVREELCRLVVHGTLHVLGYDHPEDARRESSEMWAVQERYVRALA